MTAIKTTKRMDSLFCLSSRAKREVNVAVDFSLLDAMKKTLPADRTGIAKKA